MSRRTVRSIHPAVREDIADLVTRRALPTPSLEHLDPFLFLNHHGPQEYSRNNRGLPFGPHPHRGFETVTFIFDGDLTHNDTGGHSSVIEAGGVQWMTAGRGLVHSELSSERFVREGGGLEILQLWLNLPSHLKMTDPAYTGLQSDSIPAFEVAEGKARVHLVAGAWGENVGAFKPLVDVQLMWIDFNAGARLALEAPRKHNVFFYVTSGQVEVGGQAVEQFHLAEFEHDGDQIEIASSGIARVLFGHAEPFGEPIVSHGPFVMNTREEIMQAIRDYQAGLFE